MRVGGDVRNVEEANVKNEQSREIAGIKTGGKRSSSMYNVPASTIQNDLSHAANQSPEAFAKRQEAWYEYASGDPDSRAYVMALASMSQEAYKSMYNVKAHVNENMNALAKGMYAAGAIEPAMAIYAAQWGNLMPEELPENQRGVAALTMSALSRVPRDVLHNVVTKGVTAEFMKFIDDGQLNALAIYNPDQAIAIMRTYADAAPGMGEAAGRAALATARAQAQVKAETSDSLGSADIDALVDKKVKANPTLKAVTESLMAQWDPDMVVKAQRTARLEAATEVMKSMGIGDPMEFASLHYWSMRGRGAQNDIDFRSCRDSWKLHTSAVLESYGVPLPAEFVVAPSEQNQAALDALMAKGHNAYVTHKKDRITSAQAVGQGK
jgi:hypothetical protein